MHMCVYDICLNICLIYCQTCEDSEDVDMVIIKGAGGKAFCAGGDVRGTYAYSYYTYIYTRSVCTTCAYSIDFLTSHVHLKSSL